MGNAAGFLQDVVIYLLGLNFIIWGAFGVQGVWARQRELDGQEERIWHEQQRLQRWESNLKDGKLAAQQQEKTEEPSVVNQPTRTIWDALEL